MPATSKRRRSALAAIKTRWSPYQRPTDHRNASNTEIGAPAQETVSASQSFRGDQPERQPSGDNQGSEAQVVLPPHEDSSVPIESSDGSGESDLDMESEVSDDEEEYLLTDDHEPMHQTPDLTTHPESQSDEHHSANPEELRQVLTAIGNCIEKQGYSLDMSQYSALSTSSSTRLVHTTHSPPIITNSRKSWLMNYTVLSFLMNGQLFAEYQRLSNMLGLPACSDKQWRRIVGWLEKDVTALADWSCAQVREVVRKRGDHLKWMAAYDGFYLTRGHYSNNSSATLHDYQTGAVAWYTHRTKRGLGHNWDGTSASAEGDMLNEILQDVCKEGFVLSELVVDKDSSTNAIYCRHFPEGTITYCSNHCSKTLHQDLQKIKQNKCKCRASGHPRCKRMPDSFLNSCKAALNNLIATVVEMEDPYVKFSEGIRNFYKHYCEDDHTSDWCCHDKEKDGKPYVSKHRFTCEAQGVAFNSLLNQMADRPQDYVTERGRVTTNSVEGFHGVALMYRDKRTDLGHSHYVCKTNMSICHKNIGPIWKVLCLLRMGVQVPSDVITNILQEQRKWQKKCDKRASSDYHHKRNLHKKAKKARHEQEKEYMNSLAGLGEAVGEYSGHGQGEQEDPTQVNVDGMSDDEDSMDTDSETSDAEPVHIFFDIETTGLSIYNDHITEIGAKVVGEHYSQLSSPSFASLVHTPRNISSAVTKKTGINASLLRNQPPLTQVFQEFLNWIHQIIQQLEEERGLNSCHPVIVAHNGYKFDFPLLLAEINRRSGLSTDSLVTSKWHFADTLVYLRKVKKDGFEPMKGVTKFGLEALYENFFPEEQYSAHRALADVEALERLFTDSPLQELLPGLPSRTASSQLQLWTRQKNQHGRCSFLLRALGKKITSSQAKRLDDLGLSYDELQFLRKSSDSTDDFITTLSSKGVNSRALREKLASLVKP